jgi:hypothetical protein
MQRAMSSVMDAEICDGLNQEKDVFRKPQDWKGSRGVPLLWDDMTRAVGIACLMA